jgi:integrase
MSIRIYSSIKKFIDNEEPNIQELNDFLNDLIVKDPINPTNKTVLTRYSKVKAFLREEYGNELNEAEIKQIRPPSDIVNAVLNADSKLKQTKTNIKFSQSLIDKILSYKTSNNIYELFIFLQFISGRRISEIKEFSNQIKLFKNSESKIKMKLNKKKTDKFDIVRIIPDTLTPAEFKKKTSKLRNLIEDIDTEDWNKRLNRKIKKLLGKFTSHSIRGFYGSYMFNKFNKENLNINAFLMNILNHDNIDSSISYSNYIFEK